jgi:hypothetical protein
VIPARRRALLLGCDGRTLRGVRNSLARLRGALARHGFACDELRGDVVTAAALCQALAQFEAATRAGDAVVIVYVGHGLLFENRDYERAEPGSEPRHLQALAPDDLATSTADDCHALTGLDLRVTLDALLDVADTVTLVLDCCHATGMVAGLVPTCATTRAHDDRLRRRLAASQSRVRRTGAADGSVHLLGSGTLDRAYEIDLDGRPIGAFSEALARALDAASADTAWWDLALQTQARLRELSPYPQWIGLEGPRERRIFTRLPAPLPLDGFPCTLVDGRLELAAGRLHGHRRGDRFAVSAGRRLLATTEIAELRADTATLAPFPAALAPELGPGAVARCVRAAGAFVLDVGRDPDLADRLAPLPASWRVGGGDRTATLQAVDGWLHLAEAGLRAPVVRVRRDDPDLRDELVRGLQRIGAWKRISAALLRDGWRPPPGELDIRVDAQLPARGPLELDAGEPVHIELIRDRATWPLYCSVFRVAADRTISRLTPHAHGVPIHAGERYVLAPSELAPGRGVALEWSSAPADGPRQEWLLFVVSPGPLALHCLETGASAWPRARRGLETIALDDARCHALPYVLRPPASARTGT